MCADSRRFAAARITACGLALMVSGCAGLRDRAADAARPDAGAVTRLLQDVIDARWALTEEAAARRKEIAQAHYADGYVQVLENGDTSTKQELVDSRTPESAAGALASRRDANLSARVIDLSLVPAGDAVIASYVIDMRVTFHGEQVVKRFRCTDTLVRRDGRWQTLLHTETVMPGEPRGVSIDTSRYDDYVGSYRLMPSLTYKVSRQGSKLLWGKSAQEMVPEDEDTFFFKRREGRKQDLNTSYRVTFVRDASGAVTHLRMIEFPGVEYSAIRED